MSGSVYFFFFQAEDGIRDVAVTGVQTCALPILGREVAVDSDRFVVAIRLLPAPAEHQRPEHVVGLEREPRARDHARGVAAPGGGEGRSESKLDGGVLGLLLRLARECGNVGGRDCRGLRCASARDGGAQQQKRERPLHRRDFFFAAFFLTSGLGLAARTGLTLDLRGTSMSARTRSPSSGPIKPRRTA